MANDSSSNNVETKFDTKKTIEQTDGDKVYYDELLSSAGELGKYQLLLLFSTWPFYMFGVYVYFSQMFITEVSQNHWCWIPELGNLTEIERRELAIPNDNSIFGYSRCTAYVANWTEVLGTGIIPNDTWETVPCQHGWEFNKTEIPYPTISSELGWVCDKASYQATAQSIFFVGSIFGGLIFGWVADRYGRIPGAVAANIIGCIGGVSSAFAKNFLQFTISRFIMGISYDNCYMLVYLLVLEYVAPKYRSLFANLAFAVFYSFFVTSLPFLALALGHWKTITLVTSLPLALAFLTPLLIPESPRWLLSKGRIDETVEKILVIGRINGKVVPPKLIEKFKLSVSKERNQENVSAIEIFRRPVLRKTFILICILFMCCTVVFDGLVRSIGQLDFDFFLSFAAVSFTEFPSTLICAFILDIFGRRWLSVTVMTISCIFTMLTAFVGTGIQSVAFAVVARFAVNMSFNAALQWAAELLPTPVRGSGVAIVHIFGCVATIISPYIVYLNTITYWLPLVVIGSIAGLGAAIAMTLPETAKKDMPLTFEDADNIALNQKFWEMPCINKALRDDFEENVNPNFEMSST